MAHPGSLRDQAVARSVSERRDAADAAVGHLLQAAKDLIRDTGSVDLSLRELLDRAGVGTRLFYRHFESKETFLLVLLEDLFNELSAHIADAMAGARGPRRKVSAWVRGVLDQSQPDIAALGRPLLIHAARLNSLYPESYRAVGLKLIEMLTDAITAGVATGEFHSSDPRADARAGFFLTLSVMQSHVLEGTTVSRAEATAITGFILRALQAG
ncbi:TetR/AcrR family transcriptional regulator [Mycolicibacterium sp. XJ1819]